VHYYIFVFIAISLYIYYYISCLHFILKIIRISDQSRPFKIQVSFDIPVVEGQIDADALEKWLNLLEGYFFVHNFSDREKITFALLKALPHVKHWWETYWEQNSTEESRIFGAEPIWDFLWMRSRRNITLWETMMTCT
jgi:hypothetical protein